MADSVSVNKPRRYGSLDKVDQTSSSCHGDEKKDAKRPVSALAEKTFSFWKLSRQQKGLLISICITEFIIMCCCSLISPLLPPQAGSRNVSGQLQGWIMASFAGGQFIIFPVFGKYVTKIGSKFMYLSGIFIAGGCTVLMGSLQYVPIETDNSIFVSLCFVLQVAMSIGVTAEQTSAFTVASKEFSGYFTTVFGVTEVFVGLGLTIGPLVGGVLSNLGGFSLPYFVLGGLVLCSLVFNYCLTPSIEDKPQVAKLRRKNGLLLLRHPSIIITCLAVVCGSGVWSVLDPILEPHLATYDLSPTLVGAVFLLLSASYAFSCAVCGWIAEKLSDNRLLMIPGFLLCGVAHCLLAPSPIFGFDASFNELWLIIVSLVLLGIAMSMAIIPSYDIIMRIAIQSGYQNNLGTHGLVAGLWSAMYALGDFIGPIWGGYIQDLIGFKWGLTYTAGACIVIVILLTGTVLYDSVCCQVVIEEKNSEKAPLLKNEEPKRPRAYSEPFPGQQLAPVLESPSCVVMETESSSSSWTGSSVENLDQSQCAEGQDKLIFNHENEAMPAKTASNQQNKPPSVDFVIPKRPIFRKEVKSIPGHASKSNVSLAEVTTFNVNNNNFDQPSTSEHPQTLTSDLIGSNDQEPANQNETCEISSLETCCDTRTDFSQPSVNHGAKENSPQTFIQNGCLPPQCDLNGAKKEDLISNLPNDRTNTEIKFPQSHDLTKDMCETVSPPENGLGFENGAETNVRSCESFKNFTTNADWYSRSEENRLASSYGTGNDMSAICNIYPKVVICKPLGNQNDSDISFSSDENLNEEGHQESRRCKGTLPKIIIPKPNLNVKHSKDSKHDKMAAKSSAHVNTLNQVLINRRNGIRSPLIKTFTEAYKSGMLESTSYYRRYKRTMSTPEYSAHAPDRHKEIRSHTSPDSTFTFKGPNTEASNNFEQFPDLPSLPLM